MDLDQVMRTAVRAAYRGSDVLRSRLGNLSTIGKKGPSDLVTDADIASESEIIATIRASYPTHTIVAEESGVLNGSAAFRWLIDPLDGTVNYAHQVPFFAVSIAFAAGNDLRVGVVLNPVSGELFAAQAGGGGPREPVPPPALVRHDGAPEGRGALALGRPRARAGRRDRGASPFPPSDRSALP